jgi:hypothetical protein
MKSQSPRRYCRGLFSVKYPKLDTNGVEYFLVGASGNTTGVTALPGVTKTADMLSVNWVMGSG